MTLLDGRQTQGWADFRLLSSVCAGARGFAFGDHERMSAAFLLWASDDASNDVYLMHIPTNGFMRTTLNIDDDLLEEARKLTGVQERTALIHEGLRALISRESAHRLARLGGTDPNAKVVKRRRPQSR